MMTNYPHRVVISAGTAEWIEIVLAPPTTGDSELEGMAERYLRAEGYNTSNFDIYAEKDER